jgi:hypothetical protein
MGPIDRRWEPIFMQRRFTGEIWPPPTAAHPFPSGHDSLPTVPRANQRVGDKAAKWIPEAWGVCRS